MSKKKIILTIAILIVLVVFGYMLKINRIGFSDDEWITLFVVENKGASNLVYHFSFDRPLRGYFETYWIRILGTRMLNYQIMGLAIRLADTAILFTILMLLFPKHFSLNLTASALSLIYPGFLQQFHALDYQAHLFSHLLMGVSFLLCLLPIFVPRRWVHFFAVPGAILSFLASVGIMELFVGMDLFRYFLIFAAFRKTSPDSVKLRRNTILYSLPYAVTTIAYTIWRLAIFESKRATVDAGTMVTRLASIDGILQAGRDFFNNLYRQLISAWYLPIKYHLPYIKEGELLPSLLLIAIAAGLCIYLFQLALREEDSQDASPEGSRSYAWYLLAGGLVLVVGGLVPVIFGGRNIGFNTSYNRFTFPGSAGSALIITSLLTFLKRGPRLVVLYLLVVVALFTQYANASRYQATAEVTQSTWWQMAWRAPDIIPETTLTGLIEYGSLTESYTLWGPANLIYYPEESSIIVSAEVLNNETQLWIEDQVIDERIKRGNTFNNDFSKLLLLSRRADACLHLIDGQHPEISEHDSPLIIDIAEFSHLDRIDPTSAKSLKLDPNFFGQEPQHEWCYYFQKAQLARQQEDWQQAAALGNQALDLGYAPNDPMEWLVFLQTFAYTADPHYADVLSQVLSDPHAAAQACAVFDSYTPDIAGGPYADGHQALLIDVCN